MTTPECRTVQSIYENWKQAIPFCYGLDHVGVSILLSEIQRLRSGDVGSLANTETPVSNCEFNGKPHRMEFTGPGKRDEGLIEFPVKCSACGATSTLEMWMSMRGWGGPGSSLESAAQSTTAEKP